MKVLLDTHIFINLLNKSGNLDERMIRIVDNKTTKKHISIGSIWEIIIKINIGKLKTTGDFQYIYNQLERLNIQIISIKPYHLKTYLTLPLLHRDPFDRLIISQAMSEGLTLVTDDAHIKSYPSLNLL